MHRQQQEVVTGEALATAKVKGEHHHRAYIARAGGVGGVQDIGIAECAVARGYPVYRALVLRYPAELVGTPPAYLPVGACIAHRGGVDEQRNLVAYILPRTGACTLQREREGDGPVYRVKVYGAGVIDRVHDVGGAENTVATAERPLYAGGIEVVAAAMEHILCLVAADIVIGAGVHRGEGRHRQHTAVAYRLRRAA